MKRDLRSYLQFLEEELPNQIVYVDKVLDPSKFEVTAILQNLENLGKYPLTVFSKPLNLKGEISEFPIVTNVFASRDRCAVALGLSPSESLLPLSLEYSRREAKRVPPVVVSKDSAPVKDVIHTGEAVDLTAFPIVRHHRMDPAPYIDMTPILKDPEDGFYNASFQRTMYVGPRKILIAMGPFHNWRIFRKYEERGRPAPVAIVVSHHPAFYLGVLNVAPFGADDYEVIGSIMGEPLR
ncbi:MAG: UbiD family decarboxylase, partial [Dehalococcoidia bacterium]|nr:UbiD family decarboxylase [Dehalococcoidia bacterium]